MNWDAIGAVGEIIGAAAVVISLAYLASQIRTQNKEARLSAMHDFSVGFRESVKVFTEGELADIFVRGNHGFDELSETETLRLILAFAGLFRVWEEAFVQNQDGHLDSRSWTMMATYYEAVIGAPAARRVWSKRKNQFDVKFREYVDAIKPPEYKIK